MGRKMIETALLAEVPTSVAVGRSVVYLVDAGDRGLKVGVTRRPLSRMREVLTAANVEARKFMFTEPVTNAYEIETSFKTAFAPERIAGEWFEVGLDRAKEFVERREWLDDEPSDAEGKAASWRRRAKNVGLSQKTLARLMGLSENAVSRQLRGRLESGVPEYVKATIRIWEMLPHDGRQELLRSV